MSGTHYAVVSRGEVVSTHKTKEAAIKSAVYHRTIDPATSVILHVVSGTHRSTTQVWPTVGNTYANE